MLLGKFVKIKTKKYTYEELIACYLVVDDVLTTIYNCMYTTVCQTYFKCLIIIWTINYNKTKLQLLNRILSTFNQHTHEKQF